MHLCDPAITDFNNVHRPQKSIIPTAQHRERWDQTKGPLGCKGPSISQVRSSTRLDLEAPPGPGALMNPPAVELGAWWRSCSRDSALIPAEDKRCLYMSSIVSGLRFRGRVGPALFKMTRGGASRRHWEARKPPLPRPISPRQRLIKEVRGAPNRPAIEVEGSNQSLIN